jgi:hypothetical protein
MNLISFSLWGENPLYIDGAIENVKIAREVYPGWVCRIYHDSLTPADKLAELRAEGAETQLVEGTGWCGLFWRFIPVGENHDVVIIRDTDSRLNSREKAAVDEWLKSDKAFHGMRDHIEHNVPIMGGMWGCRRGCLPYIKDQIEHWTQQDSKGSDQQFLAQIIWPLVRTRAMVHDRHYDDLYIYKDHYYNRDDISRYDPYDGTGAFPRGKVIFKNGAVVSRIAMYCYRPTDFFERHDCRPFPPHEPMKYGNHVGEIIR